MKETELAQFFVSYLSCYDLYFEVDYHRCVDIVGILDRKISVAVETKLHLNFEVIEQARYNRQHFNFSYIAIPLNRGISNTQRDICSMFGLGILVYDDRNSRFPVSEYLVPKLNRHCKIKNILSRLSDTNKLSLPGSKSGDGNKVTAFCQTVDTLKNFVRMNPGRTLKQAIENDDFSHHYHSNAVAVSALATHIKNGVIKNIQIIDKKLYYVE